MVCDVVFVALLVCLSIVDYREHKIPDGYPVVILLLGVVAMFVSMIYTKGMNPTIWERVVGFFALSFPMLLCCIVMPGSLGGGDIKLMAAAGFYLGWYQILMAGCLGFVMAGFYAVYVLIIRKKTRKDVFALGPFLAVGLVLDILMKIV